VRTEDLIVTLARESGPWTPLARVRVRVMRWLLVAGGLAIMMIALIGARADVRQQLQNSAYLVLLVVTLGSGAIAAASAMTLSVPGAERTPFWRIAAVVLAAAWGLLLCARLATGGDAWGRLAALPNHWACVAEIAGLSLVSGWTFVVMLRRAAPLQPRWSAGLAMLASAALAAAAVQIICPIDDPAHHIVSHVTPVVLIVLFGAAVGGGLLRVRPVNAPS